MKRLIINIVVIFLVLCVAVRQNANADDSTHAENIPFIDRDADGINDILQYEWGTRFLAQYKARLKKQTQAQSGDEQGGEHDKHKAAVGDKDTIKMIWKSQKSDVDKRIALKMFRDYLNRNHHFWDADGDGRPDPGAKKWMKDYEKELGDWLERVRWNIRQGLPPYADENSDGIPDDLPPWVWRGFQQNGRP